MTSTDRPDTLSENPAFLTTQILTYLGNKRALLGHIEKEVMSIATALGKERLACADLFSGSGIVARMLKKYASSLIVNDLEPYSALVNSCYLTNRSDYPEAQCTALRTEILHRCQREKIPGIITEHYAPRDDDDIQPGERAFYTHENALLLDTYRHLIDECVPEDALKRFFLAPLITEASIHVNTSGVFKGFYKNKHTGLGCFGAVGRNALSRIKGKITLREPVFSNFNSKIEIFQQDTVALAASLPPLDLVYLDPPYNQHPYGSNYFMLNLILKNRLDVATSPVSGITQDWNRSDFNRAKTALQSLEAVIARLNTAYVIISYNSEGFISLPEMISLLKNYGSVKTVEIPYNTFRGSRNLRTRDKYVSEYLFVLKK